MVILGIETSCDETGVALFDSEKGLLSNELYSQVHTHSQYGGVVPELASRNHVEKIIPLLDLAMKKANMTQQDITAIAYTNRPGLVGALLVGACVGETLGYVWQKPTIAIHHMEGHLYAPLIEHPEIQFPFLALLVSGGHTILVEVKKLNHYKILGQSIDDAVGEAFDKTAKLLGLGYPGGPLLAKLALQGDASAFILPRPMIHHPTLDFSFSGLKTAVLTAYKQSDQSEITKANLAAAFQEAAVDVLFSKCKKALIQTQHNTLIVAGGVGANLLLRKKLKLLDANVYFPTPEFCTDNGAMIAYCGYLKINSGEKNTKYLSISVKSRDIL